MRNYFIPGIICLLFAQISQAGGWDFITQVPPTVGEAWKMSFNTQSETLWVWGGLFTSTALLYWADAALLYRFQAWGRGLGIGNDDHTRTLLSIKMGSQSQPIFRGPTDVGSTLYFLGDGWMHLGIAGAFLTLGAIQKEERPSQVASDIIQAMLASTLANQIGKRSFGRESPERKTSPRGTWRPFPSFSEYHNNVPKYDAFPSGHVMTSTSTFVILDHHYPAHRPLIWWIGVPYLTLLSFQMVNNGVHWASDYPLGIAMGYVFAKAVFRARTQETQTAEKKGGPAWSLFPIFQAQSKERIYGCLASARW